MRLIDADALHKALFAKQKWVVHYGDKHNEGYTSDQVHFAIDDSPTANAVEVVRCKDCKHNYYNMIPSGEAEHGCTKCVELPITADFYCAWGEREDETD